MHKQKWINHDRITLFTKFFQFPSLLIIVEFSTLKNLGNLTTKNSTHHEFVATDHEFVATDYEFVVWTSFIYCTTWCCQPIDISPTTSTMKTEATWRRKSFSLGVLVFWASNHATSTSTTTQIVSLRNVPARIVFNMQSMSVNSAKLKSQETQAITKKCWGFFWSWIKKGFLLGSR